MVTSPSTWFIDGMMIEMWINFEHLLENWIKHSNERKWDLMVILWKTVKSTWVAFATEMKSNIFRPNIQTVLSISNSKTQYNIVCPVIDSVSTNEFDLDVELNLKFEWWKKISKLFSSNIGLKSEYSCRSNWKVENISVNFFLLESSLKSNHWRNVAYFIGEILAYCYSQSALVKKWSLLV